jgi:hypothetical protein
MAEAPWLSLEQWPILSLQEFYQRSDDGKIERDGSRKKIVAPAWRTFLTSVVVDSLFSKNLLLTPHGVGGDMAKMDLGKRLDAWKFAWQERTNRKDIISFLQHEFEVMAPKVPNKRDDFRAGQKRAEWQKLKIISSPSCLQTQSLTSEVLAAIHNMFKLDIAGNVVSVLAVSKSACAYEIDHIHPIARGGPHISNNFCGLHWKANNNKSTKFAQLVPVHELRPGMTASTFWDLVTSPKGLPIVFVLFGCDIDKDGNFTVIAGEERPSNKLELFLKTDTPKDGSLSRGKMDESLATLLKYLIGVEQSAIDKSWSEQSELQSLRERTEELQDEVDSTGSRAREMEAKAARGIVDINDLEDVVESLTREVWEETEEKEKAQKMVAKLKTLLDAARIGYSSCEE